jgi:hypothetical protein
MSLEPGVPIQAKLKVGAANDPLEREADAIAEQVMHGSDPASTTPASQPAPKIQKACAECPDRSDEEAIRRQLSPSSRGTQPSAPSAPSGALAQLPTMRGGGVGLSNSARAFHEPRFGADFSDVRVHTGPGAAVLARQIEARAFTLGHDVFFGEGEYNEGSLAGRRLLAHELAHVVQQTNRASTNEIQRSKKPREPKPLDISAELMEIADGAIPLIHQLDDLGVLRATRDALASRLPAGSAAGNEIISEEVSAEQVKILLLLTALDERAEQLALDQDAMDRYTAEVVRVTQEKQPFDEERVKLILKGMSPPALKRLEKELVLWPKVGAGNTVNRFIDLVTVHTRKSDLEESQRGRFDEKSGDTADPMKGGTMKELSGAAAKFAEGRDRCLEFLFNLGVQTIQDRQPGRILAAQGAYGRGATKRIEATPAGKDPVHGRTLSRFASELRLQDLVGPINILHWKGGKDTGHHEPNPVVLFERLSNGGNGWYFFLVSLLSTHTFLIAVHARGSKRTMFEVQDGQSVHMTPEELNEWFDKRFLPNKWGVSSRVWQIYRLPEK